MKTKKSRILLSAVSVLLVFSLLVGGTMAWFTDTEKVDANFTAGILDINVKPDIENQATLEFKNLRPMQYDNFYAELNAAGGANNVAANGMDENDFAPAPVYFQPVKITNDGTLPTKVDISVNLGDICDDGEANIELSNENNTVNWDKDNNVTCTNGLQKVLKIFVYKNTADGWKRVEGVNLNKLYKENIADPDNAAKDNTALETENMYTTAMIPAGGDATYVIAGYLPETVSNAYQGRHYHADLMFNAYQMDNGAGGGNPDEGGSSSEDPNPDRFNDNLTIEWRLNTAEGDKVASQKETVKVDATIAATDYDAPAGYVYSPAADAQSTAVTVDKESGDATPNTVVFTVDEVAPPKPTDVQIYINYVNREVEPNTILKRVTDTIALTENENYELTDADEIVKDNLPTEDVPAGYTYVFDKTPQTQTVTYPKDFSVGPNITGYHFAEMTFYVKLAKLEVQEPDNPNCPVEGYSHIIRTAADLNNVRNHMNCNFIFAEDIDMSSVSNWVPLGWKNSNGDIPYTGTFDGNGHKITGLSYSRSTIPSSFSGGLFAVNTGTIKNLTVENANISTDAIVGILVSQNAGTIENCHVSGTVASKYYAGVYDAPDGQNWDNYNLSFVGGIAGWNGGTISKCSSSAEAQHRFVGGSWESEGQGGGGIGSLVGVNAENGIIKESYSTGSINTAKELGENAVDSANQAYGILAGYNLGIVENCYVNTDTIVYGGKYSGGFIGSNDGTVKNCWSSVAGVTGVRPLHMCIGSSDVNVTDVYYVSTKGQSGVANRNGTAKTAAELTSGSRLGSFNTSIWNFASGSYPTLINNP